MTEQPTKGSGRIAVGARVGHYEILAPLGAGGMGEVYRARDSRLGRDVAVKVLPAEFAGDPERLRRFEQEARAAGVLNHPGILAIHDTGTHEGSPYVVSELLEGETLRARLGGAALPPRKAIEYGVQIARGLAAAHDKGIIHRDLKPENLFVTTEGRIKILDFGLAKLVGRDRPGLAQSNLPTTPLETGPGLVMGTVGYMSPEQVRGLPADTRSDIFSLGLVLYEMLAGRRAFQGDTAADTMTAILKEDPPDLAALNRAVSPGLERIILHCLEKKPEERYQSTRDLAFELEGISGGSGSVAAAAGPGSRRRPGRERLAWIALAAVATLGLIAALPIVVMHLGESPPVRRAVRFAIAPPPSVNWWGDLALSPDNTQLAFVARSGEQNSLWVRSLESLDARRLPGTEGAYLPFWSPDSRFIGFFAEGKLKKIPAAGGDPQTLADAAEGLGAAWSRDGDILFAPGSASPLYQVPAGGGAVVRVTELDVARKEFSHRYPTFLPDGRRYLFYSPAGGWLESEIYLGTIGSRDRRKIFTAPSRVIYASPGYLLYVREGALLAQPVDPESLTPTAEPIAVGSHVSDENAINAFQYRLFSATDGKALVYRSDPEAMAALTWFDRAGKRLGPLGPPGLYGLMSLSPDGKQLAVTSGPPGGMEADVWLCDLSRGSFTRLTSHPAVDTAPVWSPDGRTLVFTSLRNGPANIYRKTISGMDDEELLLVSSLHQFPLDWPSDGRFLVYVEAAPETAADLWLLPMIGEKKPVPYLRTPFSETDAKVSPDGRWLAYVSNESGNNEIYVGSFPARERSWRVSTGGGSSPRWSGNARELFFVDPANQLMVVPIETRDGFKAGTPRALFPAGSREGANTVISYAVSPDGQRFLLNEALPGVYTTPITVVLDWTADLKRPTGEGKN